MTLLCHILATSIAALSGFGLLSLLQWPGTRARPIHERLGLSYLVGLWLIALEAYLFGHIGIPISLLTLGLAQIPPIALFAWSLIRGGRSRSKANWRGLRRLPWWQWLLIALIASKLLYVFSMNLTEIRRTDDAFTWALSLAKVTYYEGGYSEFEMRRGYPRFPGLSLVWFAACRGQWDEFSINLAYFNYLAAFLMLFHANLRWRLTAGASLAGTYLLSTLPILLSHATLVGYADLPMALFLCFAGVYAYRHAREGGRDDLILAAFFVCCLPTIKVEGRIPYLLFGLYALFAAASLRREWLRPAALWGLTGALVAAGMLAVAALAWRYGDTEPSFLPPRMWVRIRPGNHLAEIGRPLLAHFGWGFNNWMLFGPLAAVATIPLACAFARRAETVLSLFALLLLGSYLYLFCVGGAYEFLVNGTTVNRSFLQICPTLLFATVTMTGLLTGCAREETEGETREARKP